MSRWHTTDFDMLPMRAFQPRGGKNNPFVRGMTLEGGGKGGSAPDPNPGYIRSAEASEAVGRMQVDLGRETLDFYKKQYEEIKPVLNQIMQSELDTAQANKQRADEYAAYERTTFRPVEQELVRQAQEYDTEGKRERMATQAAGDVSQAFGVARGQQNRELAAVGLRPDSNRFAALNQNLLTQEALARAGASTRARTDAENLGYARMQDAASLGRNLASNASTAYGVALSANQGGRTTATTGGEFMGKGYGQTSQIYGNAANAYGTAGNIYGQEYNSRMQGYAADQQAKGALYQGIGSAVGLAGGIGLKKFLAADGGEVPRGLKLADGTFVGSGPVSGPGGPIDDKVPAMLSNGEYVLPADTVKAIGVKKLDKMVKETHTPAAEQRKKKALKGKK